MEKIKLTSNVGYIAYARFKLPVKNYQRKDIFNLIIENKQKFHPLYLIDILFRSKMITLQFRIHDNIL